MPKVVDHDERRAELVSATWQVIAEEGLEAATIRRIAEAADCTTGRITHYFASKEEVLVAALRRVHRAAAERMLRHVGGTDPDEALRAVILEALPLDDDRRLEWKVWLAFWGRAAADPELRAEQVHRYAEWRQLLDSLLQATRPEKTRVDRRMAVDLIACLVDGIGVQAVLEPARFPGPRVRRTIESMLASL